MNEVNREQFREGLIASLRTLKMSPEWAPECADAWISLLENAQPLFELPERNKEAGYWALYCFCQGFVAGKTKKNQN